MRGEQGPGMSHDGVGAMFGFFKKEHGPGAHATGRPPRHSRGWAEVRGYLQQADSLRVLDFGSTSPSNINYLTKLGHSVYMANVVQDATKPEWLKPAQLFDEKGVEPEFDVDRFVAANLDFSGRDFDIILLWDGARAVYPAARGIAAGRETAGVLSWTEGRAGNQFRAISVRRRR
jgi:hypothetical protein